MSLFDTRERFSIRARKPVFSQLFAVLDQESYVQTVTAFIEESSELVFKNKDSQVFWACLVNCLKNIEWNDFALRSLLLIIDATKHKSFENLEDQMIERFSEKKLNDDLDVELASDFASQLVALPIFAKPVIEILGDSSQLFLRSAKLIAQSKNNLMQITKVLLMANLVTLFAKYPSLTISLMAELKSSSISLSFSRPILSAIKTFVMQVNFADEIIAELVAVLSEISPDSLCDLALRIDETSDSAASEQILSGISLVKLSASETLKIRTHISNLISPLIRDWGFLAGLSSLKSDLFDVSSMNLHVDALITSLISPSVKLRNSSMKLLHQVLKSESDPKLVEIYEKFADFETSPFNISNYRDRLLAIRNLEILLNTFKLPPRDHKLIICFLIGALHIDFSLLWPELYRILALLASTGYADFVQESNRC